MQRLTPTTSVKPATTTDSRRNWETRELRLAPVVFRTPFSRARSTDLAVARLIKLMPAIKMMMRVAKEKI